MKANHANQLKEIILYCNRLVALSKASTMSTHHGEHIAATSLSEHTVAPDSSRVNENREDSPSPTESENEEDFSDMPELENIDDTEPVVTPEWDVVRYVRQYTSGMCEYICQA
jgi:hypothetical protein